MESVRCKGSNGWCCVTVNNEIENEMLVSQIEISPIIGQPNDKPDNEASKQRLQVCDSVQDEISCLAPLIDCSFKIYRVSVKGVNTTNAVNWYDRLIGENPYHPTIFNVGSGHRIIHKGLGFQADRQIL